MANDPRIENELDRLPVPHRLANRYIVKMADVIDPTDRTVRALDFGARDSILPALLAIKMKCPVTAVDRDPCVMTIQSRSPNLLPEDRPIVPFHAPELDDLRTLGLFDFISACWSIQHNTPDRQTEIVNRLSGMTKRDGYLVIVSSLSTRGVTWHDANRADPQYVLSFSDVLKYIVIPSGLRLADVEYFWYEHGKEVGGPCRPGDSVFDPLAGHEPNAICYTLAKD